MNKYALITLIFFLSKIVLGQDSTSIEIGIRTKKQVGFYWVNGLTTE